MTQEAQVERYFNPSVFTGSVNIVKDLYTSMKNTIDARETSTVKRIATYAIVSLPFMVMSVKAIRMIIITKSNTTKTTV